MRTRYQLILIILGISFIIMLIFSVQLLLSAKNPLPEATITPTSASKPTAATATPTKIILPTLPTQPTPPTFGLNALSVLANQPQSQAQIINVKNYGAKGDGTSDDTNAIDLAQAALPDSGGVLYFPTGTYPVSGMGIILKKSATLRGNGMYLSVIKHLSSSGAPLAYSSDLFKFQNLVIEDLGFDGNAPGIGPGIDLVALYGAHIQGTVRISRCRFWNTNGIGIALNGFNNGVAVEDSIFQAPGNAIGTGIQVGLNSSNILIQRNRFSYLENGVILATRNETNQLLYTIRKVTLVDNYFDLGWWTVKEVFSGEGSNVTYSATGLSDAKANFAGLATPNKHNIRAMPVKQNGAGNYNALQISDITARFMTQKVRKGDIVVAGNRLAIVAKAESETSLSVESWLNQSDRLPAAVPEGGTKYTVYGIYLGLIKAYTATGITVDRWWDLDGKSVVPPNDTRYEVMVRHPNYTFNADIGTELIAVTHNVFQRGWSDQISTFGNQMWVMNNTVEDGQDLGIAVNGNEHYVGSNTVIHQGQGGIWAMGNNNVIQQNVVYDSQWVNNEMINLGDIMVVNSLKSQVLGNYCEHQNSLGFYGLVVTAINEGSSANNYLANNICRAHVSADILLRAVQGTSVTDTILVNNQGTLLRDKAS